MIELIPINHKTVTVLGSKWRANAPWAGLDFKRAVVREQSGLWLALIGKDAPPDHAVDVLIRGVRGAIEIELENRRRLGALMQHERADEAERGRGIPLLLALADKVEFASLAQGTRVRIRKESAG